MASVNTNFIFFYFHVASRHLIVIPSYCGVDKQLCLRSLLGWWLPWPQLAVETQQQSSSPGHLMQVCRGRGTALQSWWLLPRAIEFPPYFSRFTCSLLVCLGGVCRLEFFLHMNEAYFVNQKALFNLQLYIKFTHFRLKFAHNLFCITHT